jgi:hypothetical protein
MVDGRPSRLAKQSAAQWPFIRGSILELEFRPAAGYLRPEQGSTRFFSGSRPRTALWQNENDTGSPGE